MAGKEFFISGIDTDCGKTYIAGLLARQLKESGKEVVTTKLIQTGCQGIAEDIIEHRRLMNIDILLEDKDGTTCPFVYSYPASPHLAIEIDKKPIDFKIIRNNIEQLKDKYEIVLSEGAGGLMVPFTANYFNIDYIKEHQLPLILVASSKLGSINHTLLSLEMCIQKNINLHTFIYNQMPNHDQIIAKDSFNFFKSYLKEKSPNTQIIHSQSLDRDFHFGKNTSFL